MLNTRNPYKELKGKLNITGDNINRIRTQKNISAQYLSNKLIMYGLDIHRQAIYNIEAGKRSVTDYELCIIAEILGVSTDDILKPFIQYLRNENK